MKFHCTGEPGHGCILLPNTAGEKVRYLMDKLYDFRAKEKLEFDTKPAVQHGDITAINVTMLEVSNCLLKLLYYNNDFITKLTGQIHLILIQHILGWCPNKCNSSRTFHCC